MKQAAAVSGFIIHFFLLSRAAGATPLETLYQTPDRQFPQACWIFYRDYISTLDSAAAYRTLDSLEQAGIDREKLSWQAYAGFFKGKYAYTRHLSANIGLPMKYYQSAANIANDQTLIKAELLFHMGEYYFKTEKNYPLAFEHLLRGHDMAESIGYQAFPNADELLLNLGTAYYHFEENEKALSFLKKAFSYPQFQGKTKIELLNTAALCYRSLSQHDSAECYFHLAMEQATTIRDSAWIGIISGNLGEIYFNVNEYELALDYLYKDYYSGIKRGQLKSASYAAMLIAEIYIRQKAYDKAEEILEEGKRLCYEVNDIRTFLPLYRCLSLLYRSKGAIHTAMYYTDSLIYYADLVVREKDIAAIEKASRKIDTETHLANIRLLQSEKDRQVLIRNSIVVIAFLLLIIAWQLFRRNRLRQLKDMQILALEKKRSREELDNAQALLHTYTENLKQKTRMLDQITTEIELFQPDPGATASLPEKDDIIKRLQDATILTEDDWSQFRKLFTRVYPAFFIRLHDKFPSLTQGEVRYMALSRLGLSVQEKAAMLGISPDSVRRTRQRLSKKLDMTEQEIFDEIAAPQP